LKRRKDEQDGRSVIIQKTMKGIAFLNQFTDIMDKYYQGRTEYVAYPLIKTI
jgi:DNA-binding MarR family transcriptional regulator